MVVQSAPSTLAEQRITLRNISWDLYEQILEAHAESSAPRFVYDRGDLEIMSPQRAHERASWRLANLVEVVADLLDLEIESVGSTTFKRVDLKRGFEADSAFYVGQLPTDPDDEQIDLIQDPPPDLVVEIEISRSSLVKLDLYAAFLVSEVWRFGGNGLKIHVLEGDQYDEREASSVLTGVRADEVSALVNEAKAESQRSWRRRVQAWAEALPR